MEQETELRILNNEPEVTQQPKEPKVLPNHTEEETTAIEQAGVDPKLAESNKSDVSIFDVKPEGADYPITSYKKICLVNPFPYYAGGVNEGTVYPPLGMATMATILKERDFPVKLIDANILQMSIADTLKEINDFGADLVGVYMNIVTAKAGIELCKELKKQGIKLVLGGPFAQNELPGLLKRSQADCIVLGEGEVTFLQICKGYKLEDIQGLFFLKEGAPITTPQRPLIQNLDDIPPAAYELLPSLDHYRSRSRETPMAPLMSTRGCPYKCTFCSSSSKTSVFRNKFRVRSPEHVVAEIEHLVNNMGVKEIDVLDDNFTLNIPRANKILDLIIEKKIKVWINLQNGVRADRLTYDLMKKMKQAGVYKMGIGIESGSEEVLASIKKGLRLSAVEDAVKWADELDIVVIGFFMLGFPSDTEETLKQTIDFAIKLNPSIANFSLCIPFPGTPLYDEVVAKGYMTKSMEEGSDFGFYAGDFSYQTPNLDKKTILKYQKLAYLKFHLRPSKIIEILGDIKSWNELKWTMNTAFSLLKNMFFWKPLART